MKIKTKIVKTKSNEGTTVHLKINFLYSLTETEEDAVLIESIRIVDKKLSERYFESNKLFPMFLPIRIGKNYTVLYSRSQPLKVSTFNQINEFIKECQKNQ